MAIIYKYSFAKKIIETNTIVGNNYNDVKELPQEIIYENNEIRINLNPKDVVYGLGQSTRGMNKRGGIYSNFCSDVVMHLEESPSLYGAHNFLLIHRDNPIALFFDTPSKVTFDVGFTDSNLIRITMEEWNGACFFIKGENSLDIIKEFRILIGESYLPPLYGFGYQQSRWGYKNEEDIKNVVDKYEENDIPLDAVYLDIDYMERFKDFTINSEAFPNLKDFIANLKQKGIHLIPIIDAGVKIESGYDVYEEGIKNNYFCQDENGNPFIASVWPGLVHFPDFLNSNASKWFGSHYKKLISLGLDGFWNDMNEPAIFYTPKRLEIAIKAVKETKDTLDLNVYDYWALLGNFEKLANNILDYKDMYHVVENKKLNHYDVHNLYGYNMVKGTSEYFKENYKERMFLISRSSCIGMHRYSGIWTGDNRSWWSHLELNIKMMPNLNMVGFLYSGADTGGFGSDATRELVCRWLEFSLFTPLFRNHSSIGTRNQELYNFSNPKEFSNLIKLRYALMPYLYSEYLKALKNNTLLFTPLALKYQNDECCLEIEDELIVGDSIMIAPVYKPNTTKRYVYLPEDMLLVRFRGYNDYDTKKMSKGHHFISVKLFEVLVFILPGKMLLLTEPKNSTSKLNMLDLIAIANVNPTAKYEYFLDDGKYINSEIKKYEIVANEEKTIIKL